MAVRSRKRDRRRFLLFMYLSGSFFLVAVIVAISLRGVFNAASGDHLFTAVADAIVFEVAIAVGGAGFGSCVIGVLLDYYQRSFGERNEAFDAMVRHEGISDCFLSASDPRLIQFLMERIGNAKQEIACVGLGLGILSHNRNILSLIAARLNTTRSLSTWIFYGADKNPGVLNRTNEEAEWHRENGFNYDATWVSRYPAEISSVLNAQVVAGARNRLHIDAVAAAPTLTLIKIDEAYLFFAYGTPNIRGSESPWLLFDGVKSGNFVRFFENILDYYQSKAGVKAA